MDSQNLITKLFSFCEKKDLDININLSKEQTFKRLS